MAFDIWFLYMSKKLQANVVSLNFSYTPFSPSENVDMGQLYCARNLKAQIMGKLLGVCPKNKK